MNFVCTTITRDRPRSAVFGQTKDDNQWLYVKVKYIVLGTDVQNPALKYIQAQHNTINRIFARENTENLQHVPTSGHYAFDVAQLRVRLLPFEGSEVTEDMIERVVTPQSEFTGIVEATNTYSAEPGILNIYIAPLAAPGPGLILNGEAFLFSNTFIVAPGTVGGVNLPGLGFANYNEGVTAAHEALHAFGLPHTFHGNCSEQPFSELPTQKNPNYSAIWAQVDGQNSGKLDNRYRDCNQPDYNLPGESPPYSCINLADCATAQYEMFYNTMDYGDDKISTGIVDQQKALCRATLLELGIFDLQDGPDEPPPVETDPNTDRESTTLKGWQIALIVVGSALFIALVAVVGYFVSR